MVTQLERKCLISNQPHRVVKYVLDSYALECRTQMSNILPSLVALSFEAAR